MEDKTITCTLPERIDTSNSGETEVLLLSQIGPDIPQNLILDASRLEYISSAGLRVLLKLQKKIRNMTVTGVSPEVYSVFDMTGFTSFIKVKRRIREISTEGLKLIGTGGTGSAWKLDDEKIVKIFNKGRELETVESEFEVARRVFADGVPACIPFEIVKSNGCYGIVYELIDSTTLFELLMQNPHDHQLIRKYADLVKSANHVPYDPGEGAMSMKYMMLGATEQMKGRFFSDEEIGKIRKLLLSIEDVKTFIHGDCHPGNVMVQGDEILYIDMSTCGCGDPILDLASISITLSLFAKMLPDEAYKARNGIGGSDALAIWKEFLSYYYEGESTEAIARAEKRADGIAAVRTLCGALQIPDLANEWITGFCKKTALEACE